MSSSDCCFNPNCKESTPTRFRRGWRLGSGDYASLCDTCGSAYEEGRFCTTFHRREQGWRVCDTCGKNIHCGCIVSISSQAFTFLDSGGIKCVECRRKANILVSVKNHPLCAGAVDVDPANYLEAEKSCQNALDESESESCITNQRKRKRDPLASDAAGLNGLHLLQLATRVPHLFPDTENLEEFSDKEEEILRINKEIIKSNYKLATTNQEFTSSAEAIKKKLEELSFLRVEVKKLKSQGKEKAYEIAELRADKENLGEDLKKVKAEKLELDSKFEDAVRVIEELTKSNQELNANAKATQQNLNEITALRYDKKNLDDNLKKAEADKLELSVKFEETLRINEELRKSIRELTTANQELNANTEAANQKWYKNLEEDLRANEKLVESSQQLAAPNQEVLLNSEAAHNNVLELESSLIGSVGQLNESLEERLQKTVELSAINVSDLGPKILNTPPSEVQTEVGKASRVAIKKVKNTTENLIGCRIKVWWPADQQFYEGIVKTYEKNRKKHKIIYDDGDVEMVSLDEKHWELVDSAIKSTKVAMCTSEEDSPMTNLVSCRIKVWRPKDKKFYDGIVEFYNKRDDKHMIIYEHGDVDFVSLDKERWKLVHSANSSTMKLNSSRTFKPFKESLKAKKLKKCTSKDVEKTMTNLVGCRIKVWWRMDKAFYEGVVESYDEKIKKHKILYDDGDVETLSLDEEHWEFVDGVSNTAKYASKEVKMPTTNLIGCRIKVWWPMDYEFYEGVVKSYNTNRKTHEIKYDDGDVEDLSLDKERWELVDSANKCAKKSKSSSKLKPTGASLKDAAEEVEKTFMSLI